jgi:acetyltransferase-like isoleucine patch superfamily enzyme
VTSSEIILSICIPTCNRAETLLRSIETIAGQAFFRDSRKVEVVVSDNCSTDHTREVVLGFERRFPGLVRYEPSVSNDEDRNFERVLRHGRGRFLKLQNDTFGVHDGLLEPLVSIIEALSATQPVLFFVNEPPAEPEDALKRFDTMDGFLDEVSFKSTWIGGFGIWRDQLQQFSDFSRYADKKLIQTDALMRLLADRRDSVVIREFMFPAFGSGRKGGYNIAEVFGHNYLSILAEHVRVGGISPEAFARAKKHVLTDHILPFALDASHDFRRDNLEYHLREYTNEAYFAPALAQALRGASVGGFPPGGTPQRNGVAVQRVSALPSQPLSFEQAWRRANAHNETTPGNVIPLSKVSIGRRTYGIINAWHWGHEEEYLRIGHFCSIGAGVDFMLGGNHPTQGISTFPFKVKYFGHDREAVSRGPIVVGDDVWIGNRAMILSGVTIGQGAVIGAGSIVSRDVPPYAVVAGNPARIVRNRFPPQVVAELMKLDYSRLSDEAIRRAADTIYDEITTDNARRVVQGLLTTQEKGFNLLSRAAGQCSEFDPLP